MQETRQATKELLAIQQSMKGAGARVRSESYEEKGHPLSDEAMIRSLLAEARKLRAEIDELESQGVPDYDERVVSLRRLSEQLLAEAFRGAPSSRQE